MGIFKLRCVCIQVECCFLEVDVHSLELRYALLLPLQPCKVVCPQDVDLMYVELIQRCKQMYLTETDREDESVYQLPSFLDSIASVLIHLDKVL